MKIEDLNREAERARGATRDQVLASMKEIWENTESLREARGLHHAAAEVNRGDYRRAIGILEPHREILPVWVWLWLGGVVIVCRDESDLERASRR